MSAQTKPACADELKLLARLVSALQPLHLDAKYDQDRLFTLAVEHGVTALISNNQECIALAQNGLGELDGFYSRIRQYNQHKQIASSVIDNEAANLLKALCDSEIPFVLLKGYALGISLYHSPALRVRSDIDLFIRPQDSEKIKALFSIQHYFNPRGWEPKAITNQYSQRKLVAPNLYVDFDVHLQISNDNNLARILSFDDVLLHVNEAKKAVNQASSTDSLPLITHPYALLHAIFHLMHHRSHGDTVKLIWFYDIFLLVEALSETEKSDFVALIAKAGLAKVSHTTLQLTMDYFASDKIKDLLGEIETIQSDTKFDYLLAVSNKKQLFMESISSIDTWPKKLAYLREMAFPPKAEVYAKYGKQSSILLPFLYLRRLASGAVKYLLK